MNIERRFGQSPAKSFIRATQNSTKSLSAEALVDAKGDERRLRLWTDDGSDEAYTQPTFPSEWSADTLRATVRRELSGAEFIVVSNREPYVHEHQGEDIVVRRPASGLVSALEPILRATGGVWIAHGSGSADRDVIDALDHVSVPPEDPSYTLRRVWLSEDDVAGFYDGFSNEALWPLCHLAFVQPTFRQADWDRYNAVNRRFADVVASEAKSTNPVIFVQDYHFALLPRLLRQKLPAATIVTFWHIPWPSADMLAICPWAQEILDGLLGSSIVGFHTPSHCSNFNEAIARFFPGTERRGATARASAEDSTKVGAFPISIAWPQKALDATPSPAECRQRLITAHGLPIDVKIAVGIERLDYTKGIPERLRAIELLLEQHPNRIGRFALIQVAAPSRSHLAEYRGLRDEVRSLADRINARFGVARLPKPITILAEHHDADDMMLLHRAADVAIVTSLHDGMNLVAKEFIAARDDERGVLVLSCFAGAARELAEALIVNPFDIGNFAQVLNDALLMLAKEQQSRLRPMRARVRRDNVYRWAGTLLQEAARIRRREEYRAWTGS